MSHSSSTTFLLEHCPANPTLEYADSIEVPEGTKGLVSIGGGSTIDVGKWVAKKYGLRHTAIPTTAGTGSEVTKYCVLMVDGEKKTFTDEAFIPNAHVLDPHRVVSLPPLHTLASGLDALCQAMEASWSKNKTDESQMYSSLAASLIIKNLPICLKDPANTEARMNMLLGANLSGRAINITKTNVCHAISYPLTAWYNIPHGIACAMSLSYFARKFLHIGLDEYLESLDLPKYKIDKEKVAQEAMKSEKLADCPFEISYENILSSLG